MNRSSGVQEFKEFRSRCIELWLIDTRNQAEDGFALPLLLLPQAELLNSLNSFAT
jgi:hypothetical protein